MSNETLKPCPFCGHEQPHLERVGSRRQSCIVACGNCGARHESSDEWEKSGASWNTRILPAASEAEHKCESCNTTYHGDKCTYCHLAAPTIRNPPMVASEAGAVAHWIPDAKTFAATAVSPGKAWKPLYDHAAPVIRNSRIAGDGEAGSVAVELVEVVTKAILFEDCGNTADWRDNTDLGQAAIRAYATAIRAAIAPYRIEEVALMQQADKDGRVFNGQGHAQAIQAIDFCLASLAAPPEKQASHSEGDAGGVRVPIELANRVDDALGRFTSDEGWGQADMDTADDFSALLAAPTIPHSLTVAQGDELRAALVRIRKHIGQHEIHGALKEVDAALARLSGERSHGDERATLARLEAACAALCKMRTQEQYLSMIDAGQQDALLELDSARAAARDALSRQQGGGDADQARRDTLLSVLGKLNSNPYNLTKSECVEVVREMFDKADADLDATHSRQQGEGDAEDAARYRWWREHAWIFKTAQCLWPAWPKYGEITVPRGTNKPDAIDAAIDDARADGQ